jgi:DNA-binding transcriptional ArsR family regulator
MKLNEKNTRALDETLNALAHPIRRAILHRLTRGEARVTELAEPFAISLSAVSKHIRLLERARLVRRRKNWREHIVSFQPKSLDDLIAWLEQQRAAWKRRLDVLDAPLRPEDGASPSPRKATRKRKKEQSDD